MDPIFVPVALVFGGVLLIAGWVGFAVVRVQRTATDRLAVVYDAAELGAAAPLKEPDNVTVHAPSGDIFVAEDDDDRQLVLLADDQGTRIAAPFMQLFGHEGSEVTGPAFSPDSTRLYFSSQRGTGGRSFSPGMTFEISGPFRRA